MSVGRPNLAEIRECHGDGIRVFQHHGFARKIFCPDFFVPVPIKRIELRQFFQHQFPIDRIHNPGIYIHLRLHQSVENAAKPVLRGKHPAYQQHRCKVLVFLRGQAIRNCDRHRSHD